MLTTEALQNVFPYLLAATDFDENAEQYYLVDNNPYPIDFPKKLLVVIMAQNDGSDFSFGLTYVSGGV